MPPVVYQITIVILSYLTDLLYEIVDNAKTLSVAILVAILEV